MTAQATSARGRRAAERAAEILTPIERRMDALVVGQGRLRETLLLGLLTGGHLLLESMPGLAKTTAAHALADSVGGSFSRIQCTPDLLPADIIGSEILNPTAGTFETRLGPVHANIVLLDEINRSSAKTQSAMLEAMQEKQTSIGGASYPLPQPFLVLATQNPVEQEGTYRLPEAQLDRFMLKDSLDYPSPDEELEILRRIDSGVFDAPAPAACTLAEVEELQAIASAVYIDAAISRYIVELTAATRRTGQILGPLGGYVEAGASPRASIAFTRAARALALLRRRHFVIPEDVKSLARRVLGHRLMLTFTAAADGVSSARIVDEILARVPAP